VPFPGRDDDIVVVVGLDERLAVNGVPRACGGVAVARSSGFLLSSLMLRPVLASIHARTAGAK
jgi:hypothetical protein